VIRGELVSLRPLTAAALERAGFTREGILRHAQWRAGAWRDVSLYSKLRGE
jgi:aminoglycoside 6'-N-acetyltransferase